MGSEGVEYYPNAGGESRPRARATLERGLLGVGFTVMFG